MDVQEGENTAFALITLILLIAGYQGGGEREGVLINIIWYIGQNSLVTQGEINLCLIVKKTGNIRQGQRAFEDACRGRQFPQFHVILIL